MIFLNRKHPVMTLLMMIMYIIVGYVANHIGWFQLRDLSILWLVIGSFGIMYMMYSGEFEWNSLYDLFRQLLFLLIVSTIGKSFEHLGVSYTISFGLGLAGGIVLIMGYYMNKQKKRLST